MPGCLCEPSTIYPVPSFTPKLLEGSVADCAPAPPFQLTPEYKKLGEMVAADPKLAGRVVVAKVRWRPIIRSMWQSLRKEYTTFSNISSSWILL